jgi:hypothetical protein
LRTSAEECCPFGGNIASRSKVAPDQPFKPIYTGSPYPPDIKEIANQSNMAAASLRHHLETLPAVPKNSRMANLLLSSQELRNVVAFIISLRDKPAAPPR